MGEQPSRKLGKNLKKRNNNNNKKLWSIVKENRDMDQGEKSGIKKAFKTWTWRRIHVNKIS